MIMIMIELEPIIEIGALGQHQRKRVVVYFQWTIFFFSLTLNY